MDDLFAACLADRQGNERRENMTGTQDARLLAKHQAALMQAKEAAKCNERIITNLLYNMAIIALRWEDDLVGLRSY